MPFFSQMRSFSPLCRAGQCKPRPSKTTMSGYSIARDPHNFACDSLEGSHPYLRAPRTHPRTFLRNFNHPLHHFLRQTNWSGAYGGGARARVCVNSCSELDIVIRDKCISRNPRLCNRDYKTAGPLILVRATTIATVGIQKNASR